MGETVKFQFYWRDPWEWIQTLVCDPSLASEIQWYPRRKFYHDGQRKTRIYDDVDSGDLWWRVQSHISAQFTERTPHCYLPLHYWSDKGKVSARVKKHPVVLRPCFLPRGIRNGSGNGGGVIIALLPMSTNIRKNKESFFNFGVLWSTFKSSKVEKGLLIFPDVGTLSGCHNTIECGDKKVRVLHPGFAIASMDYEEAAVESLNRGVMAKHPCGACHVETSEQHETGRHFPRKTVFEMKRMLREALAAKTVTAQKEILQRFGSYLMENAFWCLEHTNIYLALCYDILHSDDLGKLKKLFKLLKIHVNDLSLGGALNETFSTLPPYPGLKHFNSITTIEYTDGNTMFHIMKSLVFCIANLLPSSSAQWVHLVRAYSRLRIVLGFTMQTDERIEMGKKMLKKYEKSSEVCHAICNSIAKGLLIFPDELDHPKRHALCHLKEKGSLCNSSTRTGESMIQEIKASCYQTNGKDTDKGITVIDQDQEVVSQMMSWVQTLDRAKRDANTTDEHEEISDPISNDCSPKTDHHNLGSQYGGQKMFSEHAVVWNQDPGAKKVHHNLLKKIQEFIALGHHGLSNILLWKTIYVNYTSLEDWLPQRCIIRCNPSFYHKERFDTVIVNDETLRYASLQKTGPDRTFKPYLSTTGTYSLEALISMALVRYFDKSAWKPKVSFEGMQVFKARTDTHLIYVASIIRSCHMIPVPGKADMYFLNDQLDADMFLRVSVDCE
ncbi:hypothetical protein SISSUDRAFT_990606 [Sistotremastrum suecicum HHB10207 ss-3]|uniref:Uncharacterized protein n=1 Tax=Sistotremastrum suecicum HHB10207 ss-3 TaxID=1314776 RepID=A0A166AJX7_9AGAM|nr:hypothetical protein SISSUDRAFT_990606 [Sistotremastrum suecicum HHB10207 ss-3]